jgi:hypothetical protein
LPSTTGNSRSTLSADIEPRWYERFNTKVDVGDAIGVTITQGALGICSSRAAHSTETAGQQTVRTTPRSVTFRMLHKAGRNMATSKWICRTISPLETTVFWNRQQTLHLLDKYKTAVARATQSEGSSFAQGGGRGGGRGGEVVEVATIRRRARPTLGKKFWRNLSCYKCNKKGHPATLPGLGQGDDDANLSQVQRQRQQTQKEFKSRCR